MYWPGQQDFRKLEEDDQKPRRRGPPESQLLPETASVTEAMIWSLLVFKNKGN
jgi:hypothetical protein